MKTVAIVLAAGKSERMGKNKLLLESRGESTINHVLDAIEASKVDEIVVVLGYKHWEITDSIRDRLNRVRVVINERYEKGMTSSFIIGLKHVEHTDAALLVLGDEFILDPEFVNVMIERMEGNMGKALIISPIYRGKKGHPLLFSKQLFSEILCLKENEMIRDIVHRHSYSIITIKAPKWSTIDIDTPKDFERAIKFFEKRFNKRR